MQPDQEQRSLLPYLEKVEVDLDDEDEDGICLTFKKQRSILMDVFSGPDDNGKHVQVWLGRDHAIAVRDWLDAAIARMEPPAAAPQGAEGTRKP